MAFLEGHIILFPIVICFIVFLYTCLSRRHSSIVPTTWPVLGAIPGVVVNIHRIYEFATEVLACTGGTFSLKGPMFAKMDMLCTSNPVDIQYIMSKNFPNYPKGNKFRQIFDILGDAISNSDGDLWEFHRKTHMHFLNNPLFHSLLEKTIWNKVKEGLLPVLDNMSGQGITDLQDIFQRFGFDIMCDLIMDYDPQSISHDVPCEKALSRVEEAILFRHVMPQVLWKMQQLLKVGNEKKLSDAWNIIDQFIYKHLAHKQKDLSNTEDGNFNFLTYIIREVNDQSITSRDCDKFLRDILLNLIVAGRDTTSSTLSWFFYLVAKNPKEEDKIREELETELDKGSIREIDLGKLIYLHGGLCEALRLFPPIPFQHKSPVQPDMLPSGYKVDRNTEIILCFYPMGRMESIWGKDCMEFKPERWVATGRRIKQQPSYKFPAFNSGPRSCLGKNMSFTQMKIVAATIIHYYYVELVEGHPVLPSNSIFLEMRNGLKVRLIKRIQI